MPFIILLPLVIALLIYVAAGVKIVQPYQRGVVEHLGRYKGTVDPGLRIILPVVQRVRHVDMREQVIDVPPQEVITQDNVAVSVDAVVYFEPTDPEKLLYNISNFILAVTKLAQTNLRNVIGEMSLDAAFTSRERVNASLREILDEATDKWGVRVVRVEIQRIDPPQDVMHAMHEQMKAERSRRAMVTSAEGTREAAITRAEGEKQAAILTAEGIKQHEILTAEGEATAVRSLAEAEQYRREVVAHGEASAVHEVYGAIQDAGTDERVIAIKYLEALQGIANGRATKIFIPAEMSATLGSIGGIAEMLRGDSPDDDSGEPHEPALSSSGNRRRNAGKAVERIQAIVAEVEASVPEEDRVDPFTPSDMPPPPPPSRER